MTRILLVRHGESTWNATGRWQGQADPPLSELGRHQAFAAAEAIGAVDAVAASDLERARNTAEIIAGRLGIEPVVVDPDWRERDAGEWSGLTRDEIHEQWPGYLWDDPHRRSIRPPEGTAEEQRPPGWESDDSLLTRSLIALFRLAELVGDGDVVVVTHGGVIYNLEHHLGVDDGRIPNLGGRWLTVEGRGRPVLGERLVLIDHEAVTLSARDEV